MPLRWKWSFAAKNNSLARKTAFGNRIGTNFNLVARTNCIKMITKRTSTALPRLTNMEDKSALS